MTAETVFKIGVALAVIGYLGAISLIVESLVYDRRLARERDAS